MPCLPRTLSSFHPPLVLSSSARLPFRVLFSKCSDSENSRGCLRRRTTKIVLIGSRPILTVHSLSTSYRVTYALWIIIAAFLLGTLLRLVRTQRRPYYFAHWSKWALRRRTCRAERSEKPRQPIPLPSNSRLLSLGFIFILAMILSFIGPDYITPPTAIPSGSGVGRPTPNRYQKARGERRRG